MHFNYGQLKFFFVKNAPKILLKFGDESFVGFYSSNKVILRQLYFKLLTILQKFHNYFMTSLNKHKLAFKRFNYPQKLL